MANRYPLIVDSSSEVIKELPAGDSLLFADDDKIAIGTGTDLTLYHDGSNSYITNAVGALKVATETSGIVVTIGHTTSETTVADNLTVTGDFSVGGTFDVTGALDFSDSAITNVGNISLDSISGDTDADTSITFSGSNVITVKAANENQVTFIDGAIVPSADDNIDLGTSVLEFKDAFFDGTVTSDAFAGPLTGDVTGNTSGTAATVTTAAQPAITSLGTLTTLTVDDINLNGKVVTMTGSTSDTAVFTAGTNGTLSIVTTDDAAAAANIQITADGTVDIDSAGVLTLDSGAAINLEPAAGSAILLDGTISVDGGVVTNASSITSTAFVGTLSTAAQPNITTVGTIGTGVWQGTAIASGYIAADAITGAKIADDAIDSEHYTDGSIDNAHIADDAIDSEHYTDGSIDNAHIANDAIDSEHYADGSIDLAHMSANSIDSTQYVDGSIDLAHLAADSVDGTKIADDAIDSEHYTNASIDLAHMSADSIDSTQYVDGSIDLAHMSADSIDSTQYVDGSIDTVHIADDQVTAAKLANTAVTAAAYGSSTAIPVVTVDAQGRITAATTAAISSALTVAADSGSNDTVTVGTDTLTFAGTTNEVNTIVSNNQIKIGLPDNVTIAGNLTVSGDTTTVNTATLSVEDPLISLATGNSSADSVDIGIYGLYDTSGSQDLYGGLFRDASDSGNWKLFKDTQAAPTTTVNTSGTGYAVGTLVANLTGNVTGNVTGNLTGTVATATQASITSAANLVTVGTIGTGVWQGTAIASGYIAADAITGAKIADDAIDSEHYTDGSIDVAHMSADSVDSAQYVDGSIDVAHMSANSVDSAQYVDGSIDLAHMSANSVDSTQYVDGSIDAAHLAAAQTNITSVGTLSSLSVGGTLATTGVVTLSDSVSGDNAGLIVKNTNADANPATLWLQKDSASPADADGLGKIEFYGDDDAGNATRYGLISCKSDDVTNGTEDGSITFDVMGDGSNFNVMKVYCNSDGEGKLGFSGNNVGINISQDLSANDGMQLTHASHAYIKNVTGNLYLRTSGKMEVKDFGGDLKSASFTPGGACFLNHNDVTKFTTVAGGINITGDTDTDTLTVSGNATVGGTLGVTGVATFTAVPVLPANSIDSAHYVDGSIDVAHMAANSIDSAQYVDGSIDVAHMAANSIDSAQYVDGSIDTAHYANRSITYAKLQDLNQGQLIVGVAGDNPAALGLGSDGYVLTSVSNNIAWAAASGGGGGVTFLEEDNSVYIGNDPTSTTSTAEDNVGVGKNALTAITTGDGNVAIGANALILGDTIADCIAIGRNAFSQKLTGGGTAVGKDTCRYGVTSNTAFGSGCLSNASLSGGANVALGTSCLSGITTGGECVGVGTQAGRVISTGTQSVYMGKSAGWNCSGSQSTGVARRALQGGGTGNGNTAFGFQSMYSGPGTGSNNTAIGAHTLHGSGDNSSCIGYYAGHSGSPGGAATGNQFFLGDENITSLHCQVSLTVASDKRDKTDVEPLTMGLSFINQLEPVTYRWDKRTKYIKKYFLELEPDEDDFVDLDDVIHNGTHKEPQLCAGLLAQDVEVIEKTFGFDKANKTALVTQLSSDGKLYSLSYEKFVPMLIKSVQELSTKNDALEARLAALE